MQTLLCTRAACDLTELQLQKLAALILLWVAGEEPCRTALPKASSPGPLVSHHYGLGSIGTSMNAPLARAGARRCAGGPGLPHRDRRQASALPRRQQPAAQGELLH